MNDPHWTWWDTVSGTPFEGELTEPPRTFTYTIPDHIDPVALKAKLAARAAATPVRANVIDLGMVIGGLVSLTIIVAGVWPK